MISQRSQRAKLRGLGLVELMIAMVIGMLMVLGIATLLLWVLGARGDIDKVSERAENGRYAMQLFADEIRMAGFYGTPRVIPSVSSMPSPCSTDASALEFGFIAGGNTIPVPVQGFTSAGSLTCLASAQTGTEVLVLRRVATDPVNPSSASGLNIQVSSCASDSQTLRTGTQNSDFTGTLLRQKDCVTGVNTVWPYLSRAYFLSQSNGVPALSVAELSKGALQVLPLVEGIEDMHFSYGLDFDADGSPECFADNLTDAATPPATCNAGKWAVSEANRWSNVTVVRVYLLVRSTDTFSGWKDTRTYDLGRSTASGPFNDGYKRQVYSAAIPLLNVGGPRE